MASCTFKTGEVSYIDACYRMQVEPDGPFEGPAPVVSVERFYEFFPDHWCEHIDAYQGVRPADLPKPGDRVVIVYDNFLSEPIGWGDIHLRRQV